MKSRAKLISFLMAFVMVLQVFCFTGAPALAADGPAPDVPVEDFVPEDAPIIWFSDVSPESDWYDAVYSLAHAGILCGVSENQFAPYEQVTARQVLVTAKRLLGQEVTPEYFSDGLVQDAIGRLVLPLSIGVDTRLTYGQAVNLLFRSLGALPACNSSGETVYSEARGFRFIVNVLTDLDMLSVLPVDVANRDNAITRGEFALLLDGCYQALNNPAYEGRLTSPGFKYVPISATEKYVKYIPKTIGYMVNVPFNVVRTYHNSGFSLMLDDEYIRGYMDTHKEYGSSVVGLFVTSEKTIFMTTPFAVMHEMGHFAERFMVGVGDIEPCYKAEKDSCTDLLGPYAATNHREFFGESFRFFIQERDDIMQMDLMRGVMPKTYQYFLDLEALDFVKPKV